MLKIALTLAMMTTYAEWFIKTYELRAVYPFDETRILPADAGEARLDEMIMQTPDGEALVLWVAAPKPGAPTILYLPGNAGNLANRASRFSYFIDQGFGVVALGYRGSSGSTGTPDEAALTLDAFLAFDSLADLAAPLDGPVFLYGESLGTAMAAKIAADRQADGVVLEAPFISFVDLGKSQYPNLDLSSILTQFWDTGAIIGDIEEPLLVMHGTEDKLVPFEQGKLVYELAGSAEKWLLPLDGGGHQDIWANGGLQAMQDFFDRF